MLADRHVRADWTGAVDILHCIHIPLLKTAQSRKPHARFHDGIGGSGHPLIRMPETERESKFMGHQAIEPTIRKDCSADLVLPPIVVIADGTSLLPAERVHSGCAVVVPAASGAIGFTRTMLARALVTRIVNRNAFDRAAGILTESALFR